MSFDRVKSIKVFTSGISYLALWKPNVFQTFKRLLNDWFGPKYKCEVSSYMGHTKVLPRNRLNSGFGLNYFSFLF